MVTAYLYKITTVMLRVPRGLISSTHYYICNYMYYRTEESFGGKNLGKFHKSN